MLILMLVLAVVILGWFAVIYPFVMVSAPTTATIKIPKDATAENVSDSLAKYFGEGYAKKVMMAIRFRKTDFAHRHGAYRIEKGTNAFKAMRALTSGGQTPVRVTINKFRDLHRLAEYIGVRLELPTDSVLNLLTDPATLAQYGLTPENALALVLEDTYEFYWTASAKEVIEKIGKNYNHLWEPNHVEQARELDMTPADIMTLASIVDEETNVGQEKGTIGRLYMNRLRIGMPLQADPTVRFAVGDFTIRRVLKEHLAVESPYNTYKHRGLPPGPICTTSKKTVRRILNAEPNNYLYMCADPSFSGEHRFSDNYSEHMRNALEYQHALDTRNIK